MGFIARALQDETRGDLAAFLNDDFDPGTMTVSGVRVNRKAALSMTTIWRCLDLLSSAISQAPKDIIVKIGTQRFPEYNPPGWLSVPDPARRAYTSSDYFAQVALSLLIEGNYFVWAAPDIYEPLALTVLDPERVSVNADFTYTVKNEHGQKVRGLGTHEMLHGTWLLPPGERRGISPLEALRRSIGGAIAAEEHAARFFGQGAALSFGVEVPGALDKSQKEQLRDSLRDAHAGLKNSHNIGVLTAGAKFVGGLAPTPEQAQMLATRQFSVEDLCRPFGVPPHMVGSQQPGAVSYASVNGTLLEFKQYAVLPLAQRIEAQHNRLVTVPEHLQATKATAQFKINLDGIARADTLTRYQAHSQGIQGGFITPNEARADEDAAPMDGGDQLYMQAQMTPITSLPILKAGATEAATGPKEKAATAPSTEQPK